MKKYLYIVLNVILLISCETSTKKEYHRNGKIFKEYKIRGGDFDGEYKVFYESGNLKELYNYDKGVLIDSSIIFYDTLNKVKQINYIENDKVIYVKEYYESGKILREGKVYLGEAIYREKIFDEFTDEFSVNEYYNYKEELYLNQNWIIKDNDTISKIGVNNFKFEVINPFNYGNSDRFTLIRFFKTNPLFQSFNGEVYLCFAFDIDIKNDFKNLNLFELDTVYNPWRSNNFLPKLERSKFQVDILMEQEKFNNCERITGFFVEKNYDFDEKHPKSDNREHKTFFDINLKEE